MTAAYNTQLEMHQIVKLLLIRDTLYYKAYLAKSTKELELHLNWGLAQIHLYILNQFQDF